MAPANTAVTAETNTPVATNAWLNAAVGVVAVAFAFWPAFWIYVGVGTNILTRSYFDPLNGFEIFASVRNRTTSANLQGELVAFSLLFVFGSIISSFLLFFAWRLIGVVVYSMDVTFAEVMARYKVHPGFFFALLFAYLLGSNLFIFLSASGALSNILFTIIGATFGGVLCVVLIACVPSLGGGTATRKRATSATNDENELFINSLKRRSSTQRASDF